MWKTKVYAIAVISVVLLVMVGTPSQVRARDVATKYTKIAPGSHYSMADRDVDVALAQSSAPEFIARNAEVQVLSRHGFETAVKGKDGFVCIVGRSWTSAADTGFWNPKVRVLMCVNAGAARSYLLRMTRVIELILRCDDSKRHHGIFWRDWRKLSMGAENLDVNQKRTSAA